jgi:hypothetical protein
VGPLNTPVHLTDDHFGNVRKIYMTTLKDKALAQEVQERMNTVTPCDQIIRMNTGHAPFFSAPEELVKHLLSV